METAEDVDMNQVLGAAGIEDCSSIDIEERRKIYKVLKESQKDHKASSSSINTQEESSTYNEAEIEEVIESQAGTVYGKKSNNTSREERNSVEKDQSAESFYGSKTYFSSPNHANTKAGYRKDFGDKEFSKPPFTKNVPNYASATAGPSAKEGPSRPQKPESKLAPGAAVAVRDLEPKTNNTHHGSPQPTTDVWLDSKPNGKSNRRSLTLPKDEAKIENNEEKDSANNIGDDNQDRDSPEVIEDEVLPPLMSLAFENRKCSSGFPDLSLPPLSLPMDEWVNEVGQHLFAKKVARVKREASNKKWGCLSERSMNVMSLEKPVPRTSPLHNKDEGASSYADVENSPKTRASPDNVGDTAREGSPEIAVLNMPPKQDTNTSDTSDAAIALPDTSKRYNMDSPQNSPAGRSMDDNTFTEDNGKRRSQRNRGKQGKRNSRAGGPPRSSSANFNEDNSNEAQNSSAAKNNEKEYIHDNSDFPHIGGSPYNENKTQEIKKMKCPMCNKEFPANVIESHAWECVDSGRPDDEQVAGGDIKDGKRDVTEIKRKHKSSAIDDSDEEIVAKKPKPSTFPKPERNSTKGNHLFSSDEDSSDGTMSTKKPKPSTNKVRNIFVDNLISDDEDEPPNTSRQ